MYRWLMKMLGRVPTCRHCGYQTENPPWFWFDPGGSVDSVFEFNYCPKCGTPVMRYRKRVHSDAITTGPDAN